MIHKQSKFKCQKCNKDVCRKETILCMSCRTQEKTGKIRVDKILQKEKIKKYKHDYFQKNKEKNISENKK